MGKDTASEEVVGLRRTIEKQYLTTIAHIARRLEQHGAGRDEGAVKGDQLAYFDFGRAVGLRDGLQIARYEVDARIDTFELVKNDIRAERDNLS